MLCRDLLETMAICNGSLDGYFTIPLMFEMNAVSRFFMRVVGIPAMPAYLHIPKTGGTYIGQSESDGKRVIYPVKTLGHKYVIEPGFPQNNVIYLNRDHHRATTQVITLSKIQHYFVFATVRNLFDWLVSYAGHAGGWNKNYPASPGPDNPDYEAANKSFDYLVRSIADREDVWPSRKLIHSQIFSSGGRLVVDWLNRTHSLDGDLGRMADYKGLAFRRRPPQRVGVRGDYREFYTDDLIELVYQTWGQELHLLGFDFDGCSIDRATLKRQITDEQKHSVKYDWASNQLVTGKQGTTDEKGHG